MDKTIQILLVAAIGLIATVILVALVQGKSGDFSDFVEGERSGAECRLAQAKIDNCRAEPGDYPNLNCDLEQQPSDCSPDSGGSGSS